MRSYARRNQDYRGKISIHPHDDAAHADRLSETRIEVHANDRRRKTATGCHGFVAQAGIRSARVCGVITLRFRSCSRLRSCHSERSRGISYCYPAVMSRDYDFWIYIITNRNHSVLYIGVTNSLTRRTWEHGEGTGASFPAAYRCNKLIYYEHYTDAAKHLRERHS